MPVSSHDLTHLVALIEAARSHAQRLGPEVAAACRSLDEALTTVRDLQGNGGRADEGLRPQELTTENDE